MVKVTEISGDFLVYHLESADPFSRNLTVIGSDSGHSTVGKSGKGGTYILYCVVMDMVVAYISHDTCGVFWFSHQVTAYVIDMNCLLIDLSAAQINIDPPGCVKGIAGIMSVKQHRPSRLTGRDQLFHFFNRSPLSHVKSDSGDNPAFRGALHHSFPCLCIQSNRFLYENVLSSLCGTLKLMVLGKGRKTDEQYIKITFIQHFVKVIVFLYIFLRYFLTESLSGCPALVAYAGYLCT